MFVLTILTFGCKIYEEGCVDNKEEVFNMPLQVGEIVEGKVTDVMDYGVFVKLAEKKSGLVHISEVSREYVKDIHDVIRVGDEVKVKVIAIDENGKISLSIKALLKEEESVHFQLRRHYQEKRIIRNVVNFKARSHKSH